MSSSRAVQETKAGTSEADAGPWALVRRCGVRRLLRDSFLRFRCGDGFSHARALALLLCLAVVPFLIALTGLAEEVGMERMGRVIALTALALTPGRTDALVRRLLLGEKQGDTGEVALLIGLISGVLALAGAMAQIERGANRVYGIRWDRPALRKYARALVLTFAAGIPASCGFVLVVAGEAFGNSLEQVYGWGGRVQHAWSAAHVPMALLLTVSALAVVFRCAPRRRQPGLVWLLPGILVATVLWFGMTALLAAYVNSGLSFSQTYGALAGVVALLLWAYGSGIALFFSVACAAQLEACRARDDVPCEPDGWGVPGRILGDRSVRRRHPG